MVELLNEEGWMGTFTRAQAEDAIANGARVVKVREDAGDSTPLGTKATVLGSMRAGEMVGYFVEWDDKPKIAVFVVGWKIEEITP